jgi:hypothetical protein
MRPCVQQRERAELTFVLPPPLPTFAEPEPEALTEAQRARRENAEKDCGHIVHGSSRYTSMKGERCRHVVTQMILLAIAIVCVFAAFLLFALVTVARKKF